MVTADDQDQIHAIVSEKSRTLTDMDENDFRLALVEVSTFCQVAHSLIQPVVMVSLNILLMTL